MTLSFILRAFYVSIISINKNQHDAGNPEGDGHLAYISFFTDKISLPDFDVSTVDQFWHPPLHYIISGRFLEAAWKLFPNESGNYEIAQALPLLYVTISIFLIWKVLAHVFEDKMTQNIGLIFVAFQPTFIIRSATINNDALTTLISIAIIYFLLRYIESSDFKWFFIMLFLFILGMWTKKTIALSAIPVTIIFLWEYIHKENKNIIKSTIMFLIFSPITFAWYIYHKLKWGIPFGFVWHLESQYDAPGYIENTSIWDRITDFSIAHFSYQNVFVGTNTEAVDINPLTVLIKTGANELWHWTYYNDGIKKLSYILLMLRLITTILIVIGGILFTVDKKINTKLKICFSSFAIANVISFYIFAFDNPYISSMDYRYIEAIMLCEAIYFAYLADKNKYLKCTALIFAAICALVSAAKIVCLS